MLTKPLQWPVPLWRASLWVVLLPACGERSIEFETLQGARLQASGLAGPVCNDTPGEICTVAGNGVAGNGKPFSLPDVATGPVVTEGHAAPTFAPLPAALDANTPIYARAQLLFWPMNVTLDPQGRVVIADWNNDALRRIENQGCEPIVDEAGALGEDCPMTRIAGTGGRGDSCTTSAAPISAAEGMLSLPTGAEYDDLIPGQHNLLVADWRSWKIKYVPIDPATGELGTMYCLFGNDRGSTGDDLPAGFDFDGMNGPSRFNLPSSVAYDAEGNFYISDQANLRIRIIRADADDDFSSPEAFVASHQNNLVSTFAGGLRDEASNFRRTAADYSDSGDRGPASEATFNLQSGFDAVPQMRLAIDRARNLLYVADSENDRVRVIDLNADPPTIDTFAGGGTNLEANGVDPHEASLFGPADVDVAADGSVLITDTFNHCVRLVAPDGNTIRTMAGVCGKFPAYDAHGFPTVTGDGGPAAEASLYQPFGSTIAPDGTIYIADTLTHRIRRVNPLP